MKIRTIFFLQPIPVYALTLVCLASTCWLSACQQETAIQASGSSIKIGLIAPFSGIHKGKGDETLKGIDTGKSLKPLLKNGDAIEIVTADNLDEPAQTMEALDKLVKQDDVSAVIIATTSDAVLAIRQQADSYQIPIIATISTNPDIIKNNNWITQLSFDDIFQSSVAALFVRDELLIDRVAVFTNPKSRYSSFLAKEFIRKFRSVGGEITDTIELSSDINDYTNIVSNVRNNKPDLLYLPINANNVLRIVSIVNNLNWRPRLMGSDGLLANVLANYKDQSHLINGMYASDLFSHDMPLRKFGTSAVRQFNKQHGIINTYSVLGIEAYTLLVDAMNRCEPPFSNACINDSIRSTQNFDGVTGKISIDSAGKTYRPLIVNTIQSKEMHFVVKVY